MSAIVALTLTSNATPDQEQTDRVFGRSQARGLEANEAVEWPAMLRPLLAS